jgi:hypothetical protein
LKRMTTTTRIWTSSRDLCHRPENLGNRASKPLLGNRSTGTRPSRHWRECKRQGHPRARALRAPCLGHKLRHLQSSHLLGQHLCFDQNGPI